MRNYQQDDGILTIAVSHPSSPTSGTPVRVGNFCGVAIADKGSDGKTTIRTRGVVSVSVRGVDGGGNSAVAVGDKLYYVDADTPPISKKNSGAFFGYALQTVSAGATATIDVLLAN
jgi:predicted RecA/RadA family phage recombinase